MAKLGGQRCLVTGGAGFIGARVVERLRAVEAEVVVLGEPRAGDADLAADLADASATAVAVRAVRPDMVFHLAAQSRLAAGGEAAAWAVNVTGTANLLAALPENAGLVFVSSAEVYGAAAAPFSEGLTPQPVSAYGISKLAAELLVRLASDRGRRAAIVRPGVVYGPGQAPVMLVPEIIAAALRQQPLRTTAGRQRRDLVFVEDVADGIMRAAGAVTDDCPVFNLGTGVAPAVAEVVAEIRRLTGHTAGWTTDLPYRAGEQMDYRLDPALASGQLGWRPRTGWQDGLALTVAAARRKIR